MLRQAEHVGLSVALAAASPQGILLLGFYDRTELVA